MAFFVRVMSSSLDSDFVCVAVVTIVVSIGLRDAMGVGASLLGWIASWTEGSVGLAVTCVEMSV